MSSMDPVEGFSTEESTKPSAVPICAKRHVKQGVAEPETGTPPPDAESAGAESAGDCDAR